MSNDTISPSDIAVSDNKMKDDGHHDLITLSKEAYEKLVNESAQYLDGWKRAKADYVNFKKDMESRQKEFVQFSTYSVITAILPLYNHFCHAFEQLPDDLADHAWVEGMRKIKQELTTTLTQLGVQPMDALHQQFDPMMHEAIGQEPHDTVPEHTIVRVVENGYLMHGKPIIPAKVIVSQSHDSKVEPT